MGVVGGSALFSPPIMIYIYIYIYFFFFFFFFFFFWCCLCRTGTFLVHLIQQIGQRYPYYKSLEDLDNRMN